MQLFVLWELIEILKLASHEKSSKYNCNYYCTIKFN